MLALTVVVLMDKINEVDEGAFAPLSRQPFIRAALMPFGGTGIMALVQSLSQ